jgi:hypothetical protein
VGRPGKSKTQTNRNVIACTTRIHNLQQKSSDASFSTFSHPIILFGGVKLKSIRMISNNRNENPGTFLKSLMFIFVVGEKLAGLDWAGSMTFEGKSSIGDVLDT